MTVVIHNFSPEQAGNRIGQLAGLLLDAVESGASLGFLPPVDESDAAAYWNGVIAAMLGGTRILLAAVEGELVQGSVQLALEMRANGNHRAEVMKLMVHRRARRRGVAKELMAEVELTALRLGRTLLFMDTRKGGEAEELFASIGYVRFGEAPGYARSANGELHTTAFFYRQLPGLA